MLRTTLPLLALAALAGCSREAAKPTPAPAPAPAPAAAPAPVAPAPGPSAVLDYWFAATTLGTDGTAKSIVSIAMPIVFEFPVKLVGTTSAATADASITNVVIGGKVVGVK
jgi:hypothetical protein